MTIRESDGRIVPQPAEDQSAGEKPGNAGPGKAARVSRDPDRTSPVLSDGTAMIRRPGHMTTERRERQVAFRCCRPAHTSVGNRRHEPRLLGAPIVTSEAWEPDALTAHVRIYERANSIVQGSNIVTPPKETGGQQGKQTVP